MTRYVKLFERYVRENEEMDSLTYLRNNPLLEELHKDQWVDLNKKKPKNLPVIFLI